MRLKIHFWIRVDRRSEKEGSVPCGVVTTKLSFNGNFEGTQLNNLSQRDGQLVPRSNTLHYEGLQKDMTFDRRCTEEEGVPQSATTWKKLPDLIL